MRDGVRLQPKRVAGDCNSNAFRPEKQKARLRRRARECKERRLSADLERLGEFRADFSGMRVVALFLTEAVALFEHAIEFVDHQRHGFVTLVGGDGGIEVGALYVHMAFGNEPTVDRLFGVTFQLHADADDPLLVSKQSLDLFTDERFERGGEFEVNAADDNFVLVVVSVHDCVFVGLTDRKNEA